MVFFQAEDGIRDVERSRGLGDVYKRQLNCLEEPRTNRNEIIVKGACNNRPRPSVILC